jgi:hypothetical protein
LEQKKIFSELEELTKKLDEIGYDPKDKVRWKLYKETEDTIYKLDSKYEKLGDTLSDLKMQKYNLQQRLQDDILKMKKIEKDKLKLAQEKQF